MTVTILKEGIVHDMVSPVKQHELTVPHLRLDHSHATPAPRRSMVDPWQKRPPP